MAFVGRSAAVAELRSAVAVGEARWVSGPAGIGKSALVDEAVADRKVHTLDGAWMQDAAEGLVELAAQLDIAPPRSQTRAATVRWLTEHLSKLAVGASVLHWEGFDRVERQLANIFLHVLKRGRPGYAVVLESREHWIPPDPYMLHVPELSLGWLSASESDQLCRLWGYPEASLPPAIVGHPFLMQLYLTRGATSLQSWASQLRSVLDADQLAALERMALTYTKTQREWARQALPTEGWSKLGSLGVLDDAGDPIEPLLESIRAGLVDDDSRQQHERGLLKHLLAQARLSPRDEARSLEICTRYPDDEGVALLLRKAASGGSETQLARLQPVLDRLMGDRGLSARAKLLAYRTTLESYAVAPLLAMHDAHIDSPDSDSQLLARLNFLRAAVVSGHRELPELAAQYFEDISSASDMLEGVRDQASILWGYTSILRGPEREATDESLVDQVFQAGDSPRVREAVATGLAGLDECWKFQFATGLPKVEQATAVFSSEGCAAYEEFCNRYLLVFYYLHNLDGKLLRLLDHVEAISQGQRSAYLEFWRGMLEWQDGRMERIHNYCAGLPDRPHAEPHPLLPGPHLDDYLPYVFVAVRDRDLDTQPSEDLADVLEEAVRRLRLSVPINIAAVVFTQHCLLMEEHELAGQLVGALLASKHYGAVHGALLLQLSNFDRTGCETTKLVECLTNRFLVTRSRDKCRC